MGKAKQKAKSRVRSRKEKKSNLLIPKIIVVFVIGLILSSWFIFQLVLPKKLSSSQPYNLASAQTTPSPTQTPTPSPTPIPTKTIPPGFCLSVPVLFYHHIEPMAIAASKGHAQLTVDPAQFENHMKYLIDRGYNFITAEELINAVKDKSSLPAKSVVVSIDDGYSDNYDYAFPIIKKYNVKTSLFLSTGLVGNSGYLTWGNLSEMVGSGLLYVYNHTWSHYSLGRGDLSKTREEILTAQSQIETYLGKKPSIFAYPYGSTSQIAIDVLKENGFTGAFTTVNSWYQCDSSIYLLPRIRIGNASLSYFGL